MKTVQTPRVSWIALALFLVAVPFYILLTAVSVPPSSSAGRFHYGVAPNLIGASPAEVGQYTLEYVQATGQVKSGTPKLLLSRSINNDDLPSLGLGCPLEFAAIEEPPLMLVILKGNLQPQKASMGVNLAGNSSFVGYIFDVWAGRPTLWIQSFDGSKFRKVLNDPALPIPPADANPTNCPPRLDASKKTYHYGDTIVGAPMPQSGSPVSTPATTVTPILTVPAAVPTLMMTAGLPPSPVPTNIAK